MLHLNDLLVATTTTTLSETEDRMSIERVEDREELREFLLGDRLANAYMLGNLDPAYFQFCRWYGQRGDDGALGSVVLLYTGLSIPVVFMAGTEPDFENLLRQAAQHLPERFHFHVLEDQMDVVREVFHPASAVRMKRMGLHRDAYARRDARPADVKPQRLGHRDTAAIMNLYQHYPDNFFEPYQLETGLYFGVRDEELGLSSIAGIHVVSEDHDVAVIGNFVTHPRRRGRGLASACTSRLLDDLFERVSYVALNVQEDNEPAVRLYGNFGFEQNNVFYEGRTTE